MIPQIDTHQHLIYPDRLDYAWTEKHEALAGKGFRLDDYRRLTEGAGVAGTIFMECAVADADYRVETRMIATLAQGRGSGILGLIAGCRPETDEGFQAWLDESSELGVVGYRRILHEVPDDVSQSSTFRANLARIGRHGRPFDMVFRADQLKLALDLARACDGVQLVLDHCGVPDIAAGAMDPWREDITALAKLPHVHVKISGVLAYCAPEKADLDAIRPYVDHVIGAFGPQRCLWGSDWPVVNVTGADLPGWIEMFREIQAGLSQDEAEEIGHRSAERVYRVTLPASG